MVCEAGAKSKTNAPGRDPAIAIVLPPVLYLAFRRR